MALNIVELPYSYFPDFGRGRPLFNADIYVGNVDTDPEIPGNQKQVTVRQEDGSEVQIAQPVKTSAGGVPTYLGSPVTVLVDGAYSIKVLDRFGAEEYYAPDVTKGVPITPESLPTYTDLVFDSVADMITGKPSVAYSLGMTLETNQGNCTWVVTNDTPNGFNIVPLSGGLSATAISSPLNLAAIGMLEGRDNADVVGFLNTSAAVNISWYLQNGTHDSSVGLSPEGAFHLEGESQLGAILNITDANQDCFTWRRISGVVNNMTFSGGRDGHVLGADASTANAGRELEMNNILFLNNGRDGRSFNGGWATNYSKIKVFNPGRHVDIWNGLPGAFLNNIKTTDSMRTSNVGDPITIKIDAESIRECGYDGEIILEGNFNANSVAVRSTGPTLLGLKLIGIYGETHTEGYIDLSASVCHDVEISCNLIGYTGPEGTTVYGIKDPNNTYIHDSNFTGDTMAPITSVNGCLVTNCHARDAGGSYTNAQLIFDPNDSNAIKITSSVIYSCGDNIQYAMTMPGYFQGEIPAVSTGSQSIFGVRSIGYLPDGNDLDHMFTFRKFGANTFSLETMPTKIVFNYDGTNYNAVHAPAGTVITRPSVGVFDITLPTGTFNNAQGTRFYDAVFVNRQDSGSRLATAVPQAVNANDDTIRVRLYDSSGALTGLEPFELVHVSVSFFRAG